jgi:hypothetical protein
MEPVEKIDSLDFAEELKMINICALGPMRVSSSLVTGGLLKEGSKIIMITSQGGAISWRPTQNPDGGDYGHHVRIVSYCAEGDGLLVNKYCRLVSLILIALLFLL